MDEHSARLQAALGDRYTLQREAGQGGMAIVYEALDRKHGRTVALKVLRPELAASLGTDRFLREIELAARLQHPHIVPVYDSGADDGHLFYVMPFIEGESLRERITREGPFSLEEAQRILREVASALAYAHQRGIIHRDIKPENILLSGGHAVVADFGIARAVEAGAGDANLTGVGMAIGTPAYMAPEQATASDAVDARADQYALACVYFEMLTGRQPFTGPTPASVMAQSVTAPRPRASAVRQELPASVDGPLGRALDPDPGRRFPDVLSFATAATETGRTGVFRLGWPLIAAGAALLLVVGGAAWWLGRTTAGTAVVEGAESIAIVPFSASGRGVGLLGEGMVDLLAANLDGVGGVRIIEPRIVLAEWARRGDESDRALATARGVGAQAVLTGSIVGTGQQVRLVAELLSRDGTRLARAQLEGPQDSVLSLVDELSASIVRDIWASTEPIPSLRVSSLTTTSVPALEAYLEGEQYYRRSAWDSATAAFGRAIEADSTFALAWYKMGTALGWTGAYGSERAREASSQAAALADRLSPRDQSLLRAYDLFQRALPAAADSMAAYVRRYPDDIDGWYLLGEARVHTVETVPWTRAELLGPFDRVLALDSTLAPAAIHPAEYAVRTADSVLLERYLRVFDLAGARGSGEQVRFIASLIWPGYAPADTSLGGINIGAGMTGLLYRPDATWSDVEHAGQVLASLTAGSPGGQQFEFMGVLAVITSGQLERGAQLADSMGAAGMGDAMLLPLTAILMGYAPEGYRDQEVDRILAARPQHPFMRGLQALLLLARGEPEAALRAADAMLRDTLVTNDERGTHATRALRGSAHIAMGDTALGMAELSGNLGPLSNWNTALTAPMRLQMALVLGQDPDSTVRERGIALLENGFAGSPLAGGIVQYHLARAYERAGRPTDAVAAWSRFLRSWERADPSLEPYRAEAREALKRLTGEPAPRAAG